MLPEVATILARAETGRYLLAELLEVVSDPDYRRRAGVTEWSVAEIVAHVTSADLAIAELVGHEALDLSAALELREERWGGLRELPAPELRRAAESARETAVEVVSGLGIDRMASTVWLPSKDGWGQRRSIDLRSYLASWAEHDVLHVLQIRAALRAPLNPSVVALTVSRGRRER